MGVPRADFAVACEAGKVTIHIEVLSEVQRAIMPVLGPFATARGFYLGGGTALALYFGHRRSEDFDWFLSGELGEPLILAEQARKSGLGVEAVQVAPGTLHAVMGDVRVSFFSYLYPPIAPCTVWQDYSAELASLDDLACMKLAAIAQRGSRKDFVDVYTIAVEHKPIDELLKLYCLKYATDDITHVLVGLTYFDDAEEEPSPVMLRDTPWEHIKSRFQQWSRALAG